MKMLLAVMLLAGSAIGQNLITPSPDQFVGTYAGTWQSQYGSGVTVLSITTDKGAMQGRVVITGSPVGYKGDSLIITSQSFADDIMTISFKAKHGRLTGTGIFQNGTFIGDYRFRYLLSVDRGQWKLQK